MPHIVLEYADILVREDGLDFPNLLRKIHHELATLPTFKIEDIKSRALPYSVFGVADDINRKFIHIELRLLAGRSAEHLQAAKNTLLDVTAEFLPENCALTIELREMVRGLYEKR